MMRDRKLGGAACGAAGGFRRERAACRGAGGFRREARACGGAGRYGIASILAVLATGAMLASCASPQRAGQSSTRSAENGGARPSESEMFHLFNEKETYRVSFVPEPNPIQLVEPFWMKVLVRRHPSGEPLGPEVSLKVDAAMPEHRHGMTTQPRVTRDADGWFHVDGMMFHMPGHWEIYFDVIEGAVSERATFEIEME